MRPTRSCCSGSRAAVSAPTGTSTTWSSTRRSTPDVCDQDGKPLFRRKDDEPDTIRKRLATYHKQTEPLRDYYEERGYLRRFDGTRDKTEVHDHIRATLATLRLEERL